MSWSLMIYGVPKKQFETERPKATPLFECHRNGELYTALTDVKSIPWWDDGPLDGTEITVQNMQTVINNLKSDYNETSKKLSFWQDVLYQAMHKGKTKMYDNEGILVNIDFNEDESTLNKIIGTHNGIYQIILEWIEIYKDGVYHLDVAITEAESLLNIIKTATGHYIDTDEDRECETFFEKVIAVIC